MKHLLRLGAIACVLLAACSLGAPPVVPTSSTIVGRVIEFQRPGETQWQPFTFSDSQTYTAAQVASAIASATPLPGGQLPILRYRLTVRDTSASPPNYDVLVSPVCFDSVAVGGHWPNSALAQCR